MEMPEKIPNYLFAPCGMNCMVCYVHLKEKKPCLGCLEVDTNKPDHCRVCSIKSCANEKGHSYCYECTEFPCKKIKNLEKSYKTRYHTSLVENSLTVKNNSIDYFLMNEKSKWKCNSCNGVISLHDRVCSHCKKSNPIII